MAGETLTQSCDFKILENKNADALLDLSAYDLKKKLGG